MIIVAITFTKNISDFDNLLKVWEYTAKKYMPDAKVKLLKIPPPEKKKRPCDPYMAYTSSYAFMEMVKWVLKQNENCIITDADIMFTGNCEEVFNKEFDIAVTVRDAPCWINAGVVFYKPTQEGKRLLQEVFTLTLEMARRPYRHLEALKRFLGADQAALALLTEKYNLLKLPCEIWNNEQHSIDRFSEETKIVHMKSSLWDLVHNEPLRIEYPEDHVIFKVFDLWKENLKEAEKECIL